MDQVDPADAIKRLVQEGEAAIERGDRPAADLAFGQAFDFAEALLTGPADAFMINCVTWDVDRVLGHTLPSLMASGQWEQAARLLRRACRIYKTIGWEAESTAEYQKRMVAIAGYNLAFCCYQLKHFGEANSILASVQPLYEGVIGQNQAETAKFYSMLGDTKAALGQPAEAIPFAAKAIDIFSRTVGPQHEFTTTAASRLLPLLEQGTAGDWRSVRPLVIGWLASFFTLAPQNDDTLSAATRFARVCARSGDAEGAGQVLAEGLLCVYGRPPTAEEIHAIVLSISSADVSQYKSASGENVWWKYPLATIAVTAVLPLIKEIGNAPDLSFVGVTRNGLTAFLLFAAGIYVARKSVRPDGLGMDRWFLWWVALACLLYGAGVFACLTGQFPGLYPRLVLGLFCAAFATVLWAIIANSSNAEGKSGCVMLLFWFGAIATSLGCVLQIFEAMVFLQIIPQNVSGSRTATPLVVASLLLLSGAAYLLYLDRKRRRDKINAG
jgi:hypothetical protein